MKKLLIVGAGGFGREVLEWVKQIQARNRVWESVGFLDDNIEALSNLNCSVKVVGKISEYVPKEDQVLTCAIGDTKTKLKICDMLLERGATFVNIIHPTAIISEDCRIGSGIILCPYAILSTNVIIGDFVIINTMSIVGHDATLERGVTLSAHCDIMGHAYLEEGVYLGGGARVIPSVRVGKYTKVGAGSIVISNVKEEITVFGTPARQIY